MKKTKENKEETKKTGVNSTLLNRLMTKSSSKYVSILEDSVLAEERDYASSHIYALNIAGSGSLHGGLPNGVAQIAGKSRHFKSMYLLLLAKAYLDKHQDAFFVFFDSEFGIKIDAFKSVGIDPKRVIHIPITSIEFLKTELYRLLEELERGNKVFFGVDSIGMLPSTKEINDTLNETQKVDMTKAKEMASFFRLITSRVSLLDVPVVIINHTYETLELYSKTVVQGGEKSILASETIWIIKKRQEKDKSTGKLEGNTFSILIEKSRTAKEKTVVPITVEFDKPIDRFTGLFEMGLEADVIVKPTSMTYAFVDPETGEIPEKGQGFRKDIFIKNELPKIIDHPAFIKYVYDTYSYSSSKLVEDKDDRSIGVFEEDDE